MDGADVDPVELRLLGPVELRIGGRSVDLGPTKARLVFALLMHEVGRTVPMHRMIELLWHGNPPRTAKNVVHGHVFRLRGALAAIPGSSVLLDTAPAGYLLRADPASVDAHLFRALVEQAGVVDDDERRVELLRRALALWRGRVAMDTEEDGEPIAFGHGLAELRLVAVEDRVDAELRLGRHRMLIDELATLVGDYPLRERPVGQLMLALYRSDRRADALHCYQQARDRWVEELGLEPAESLRRLQHAMLNADPALELPAISSVPANRTTPRQLPSDIGDFTARQDELRTVLGALRPAGRPSSAAVPTVAIFGCGGVGKTSLALHAAHQVRQRFPDGQLWVNLGGAGERAADPGDVLAGFLHTLGVGALPPPDRRAALYRSLLAGRRMLVVLDNATSERQVRQLIPGDPGCAVLITSRSRLSGLPGARHVELDMLGADAAKSLLTTIIGGCRTEAEPAATEAIARLCGGLPLALRIAGARLAARPHWTVSRLADQLADEHGRLDVLRHADLEVRASMELSYRALDQRAQLVLLLLSLLDAPDFASWVAAALLDSSPTEADDLVDALVDARLVEVQGRDAAGQTRFRLHDLIRLFSRERAEEQLTEPQRTAALNRAGGAWLGLVDRTLSDSTARYFRCCPSPMPRWPVTGAPVERDPRAWLESERAALVAMVRQAAGLGSTALAWDLAASLADFFETAAYPDDWRITHEVALRSCRQAGDRRGEAVILRCLGELHTDQDRVDEAVDSFLRARDMFAELGERHAVAVCDGGLGHMYRVSSRYDEAIRRYQDSAEAAAELGSLRTEAYAVHGCGVVHLECGRPEPAERCFLRARALAAAAGHSRGEAQSLRGLALLRLGGGALDEAEHAIGQALAISRRIGDPANEANAMQILADVRLRQGNLADLRPMLDRCLRIYQEVGEPFGEALTLRTLGDLHRAANRPAHAVTSLERSVRLWRALSLPLWHARALDSLGSAYQDAGNADAATEAWTEAVRLFQSIGSAEANLVSGKRR